MAQKGNQVNGCYEIIYDTVIEIVLSATLMSFFNWWSSPKPPEPSPPNSVDLHFAHTRLLDPVYRKYSPQEAEEALALSRKYWRLHRQWLGEFSKEDRSEIRACDMLTPGKVPERFTQSKTWSLAQDAMKRAVELEANVLDKAFAAGWKQRSKAEVSRAIQEEKASKAAAPQPSPNVRRRFRPAGGSSVVDNEAAATGAAVVAPSGL